MGGSTNSDARTSGDELGLGRRATEFFRREPGILLTAGYLLLSAIGMTYKYFLFLNFGVNVFDISDVNDFLIAGLRHPVVVGFTVLSCLLLWAALALERWIRREGHQPKRRTPGYLAAVYGLAVTLWFVAMALIYAQYSGKSIVEGKGQQIAVTWQGKRVNTTLVGMSSRFVVIYDRESQETSVIPLEQVERISYGGKPSRPASEGP